MNERTERVLLVLIAAVTAIGLLTLVALTEDSDAHTGSKGPDSTPLTCDGKTVKFHKHRAERLIDKAHDRKRFLDPSPATKPERRAWQSHTVCLTEKKHREQIRDYQDDALSDFNAYYESLLIPPGRATLAAIAQCESHGNYSTNTGNGYSGAYQFSDSTWQSVGGSGSAYQASAREQDYRAARLYREAGSGQWPVCGV